MKLLKLIPIIIGSMLFLLFILPFVTFGILNAGNGAGMLFSCVLITYGILLERINRYVFCLWQKTTGKWVLGALAATAALTVVFVIISSVKIMEASDNPPDIQTTVVVLGCQVRDDGPSLMLTERLVAAYEFLVENEEADCILSGGQGSDEPMSEAECMYRWLVSRGIDKDRLYMEDKSTSTDENLLFSKRLIEEKGLNPKITIITNDFHQYRAAQIADDLGIESYSVSGKTNIVLFPTYFLREIGGVLYELIF